jgi:hypothetical protein
MLAVALKCHKETGIWFLARGGGRINDEMETYAVWGQLLFFCDLEELPGYSEENKRQAIEFWQSWRNQKTGRVYNPLYQDPQNPEIKRNTPGNSKNYSPDKINIKYIPSVLACLGARLPGPVNALTHADAGADTFDQFWQWIPKWATSPAGAFPVTAAREMDQGRLEKIPQVEAGLGALIRAYNRETGMWRPEPLKGFPWRDYQPSSGFKIISRICGYVGLENFPEALLKTATDNLLAHKGELYAEVATARNYSETMAHHLMLSDYRRDEQLAAMEECLNGFRDRKLWENTASSGYCVFGSGFIGAFMNWEDLPLKQALSEWIRFEHGCRMNWRLVVDPYANWVNVIPKEPEAVYGHPQYDVKKYGLKARNKLHWAKKITELAPQREVALSLDAGGKSGAGTFEFALASNQLVQCQAPYLKATWNGAYDVLLNGQPVKQVRYNLPDLPAGWQVPASAAATLRAGTNTVSLKLLGPGKDQKPGAPLSPAKPFIRLGLITWQ